MKELLQYLGHGKMLAARFVALPFAQKPGFEAGK
jgi:hypothetical protein